MELPEYSFDLAKAITIAFPIPLLDPVTIATLLFTGQYSMKHQIILSPYNLPRQILRF
jgi:hypothetical protein